MVRLVAGGGGPKVQTSLVPIDDDDLERVGVRLTGLIQEARPSLALTRGLAPPKTSRQQCASQVSINSGDPENRGPGDAASTQLVGG